MKIDHNPRTAWAAILLAAACLAAPAMQAQLPLVTVVDMAQHNSYAVKLAEADVQRAISTLSQTKDVCLPNVLFGSGLPFLPSVGFTGGVPSIFNGTVQSVIPTFSQLQYIRAAHTGVKASILNLKDAREQVALDASTAYIELDTVNAELQSAHQQEALAGKLVEIERQRTEAGVDPLSDLLQARLTAAELKLKRLHLETRASTLAKQIAALTGMPAASIETVHASIPEIPSLTADEHRRTIASIRSAQLLARSKQQTAKGDTWSVFFPQIVFDAEYSRSTKIFNDADAYFARPIPTNNFNSGFSVQIPLFDFAQHAKAKQSSAEALRSTVEAEQDKRQNEIQITSLTGTLRELDTMAEIANLKQQIAHEQLQSVLAQLELGNGSESSSSAQSQLSPKAEQLARIDESQKSEDALDAGLELSKARLDLLRALGHMEDWLQELHEK